MLQLTVFSIESSHSLLGHPAPVSMGIAPHAVAVDSIQLWVFIAKHKGQGGEGQAIAPPPRFLSGTVLAVSVLYKTVVTLKKGQPLRQTLMQQLPPFQLACTLSASFCVCDSVTSSVFVCCRWCMPTCLYQTGSLAGGNECSPICLSCTALRPEASPVMCHSRWWPG